jgi:thiol:disulfide interchange protein DsbD
MNIIQALFGILFIAIAIHLISRIIPPLASMILWASLLIFSGIYSGALTYSVTHRDKFAQGIGLILLAYGFLILIGAGMGTTNPMQPLSRVSLVKTNATKQESKQTLRTIKQLIVNEHNNPIMLDFYADWCASCKIMEETTFKDPRVLEQLAHFTVFKVDITQNNAENKAILNHFQVIAPPTFLFFNSKGQELPNHKLVGEISADKLLMTLNKIYPL